MENINLNEIIKAAGGTVTKGNPEININKIGIDSRTIEKDSLFFAIKGKTLDGHEFIKDAVQKEVAAVIYSTEGAEKNFSDAKTVFVRVNDTSLALESAAKIYKRKFKDLVTVSITGSNGKTTTKEMIASILKQRAKTLNNQGNFNNRIGVPLTVFNISYDTKYAVFELGTSEFGEIKALTEITEPDYAVITNIGSSHLEFFKTQDNVLKEKREIINGLKYTGTIALNIDNSYLKSISADTKKLKKSITFGFSHDADVYADNIKLDGETTVFDITIKGITDVFEIPIKSKFNILNALGAAAVAYSMGFSIEEIKNGLKTFTPPKMRMQTVKLSNGALAINDAYNANPSSMSAAISSLEQSYPGKNIILVIGDMLELGENSPIYHAQIGTLINKISSVQTVYMYGDKIKFAGEQISGKDVHFFTDREMLLDSLKTKIKQNSLVFFKASRGIKLDIIYDKLITSEI